MRVKTFEAATMQDALAIVKREMGEEAFILSTRTRRKPSALGLGEDTLIEVTAAMDEGPSPAPVPAPVTAPARPGTAGTYGLRPPLAGRAPEPQPARLWQKVHFLQFADRFICILQRRYPGATHQRALRIE